MSLERLLKRTAKLTERLDGLDQRAQERFTVRTWADLLSLIQCSPERRRQRFGPGPYHLAPALRAWWIDQRDKIRRKLAGNDREE